MEHTKRLLTFVILVAVLCAQFAAPLSSRTAQTMDDVIDTSAPPEGYSPRLSEPRTLDGVTQTADILLIQTAWPWDSDADVQVLNALGYAYDIVDMDAIGSVNIFSYPVVLVVNDQVQAFYDSYAAQVTAFENYVINGGTLVFFAASDGWAGGTLNAPLPGGVDVVTPDYEEYNYIVTGGHPIVTAELSDGIALVDSDLLSNYCSHGHFESLPAGTVTIFRDDDGTPTMIEYPLGSGKVIASTNTWEHAWANDRLFGVKALDDVFLYAFTGGWLPQTTSG